MFSELEREEIIVEFLEKRQVYNVTLLNLQKHYGISKGTYSKIKNHRLDLAKIMFAKMKHFNKTGLPHPVMEMNKETHTWCPQCLDIIAKANSHKWGGEYPKWYCPSCYSRLRRKHRQSEAGQARYLREHTRRAQLLSEKGEWWKNFMKNKNKARWKQNYGEFYEAAKLIQLIQGDTNGSKEINREEIFHPQSSRKTQR